ncbi:MAG: hypothetical protein ACFFD5_13685 [Candidatus Thorarchaeota archaeon]
MDEGKLEEIDDFLYEHASERFNRLFKFMLVGQKRLKSYLMLVVRALVRCLHHVDKEIYIKDIMEAVMAEADYMLNEDPFKIDFQSIAKIRYSEEFQNLIKSEIHGWILYLLNNDKLPSNLRYERFVGRLTIA